MTKEMYKQPKGVKDTLIRKLDENGRIKLDDIKITKEDLDKMNRVYIVVCGTAYHESNIRGLDIDNPRNLAKSVTVE